VGVSAREGGNVAEMQRRRLLLAIAEVVGEDGLEFASVGRVCKRAGMSRRTFYELFDDREACFLAAFEGAVRGLMGSIVVACEREDRWQRRIRAALTALLECFDSDPALARLCLVETLKASPAVLEYRRGILEALSGAIDEGRREAKGAKAATGPVPLTAESTVGGVLSVLHARVLARLSPLTGGSVSVIGDPRQGVSDPGPLIELLNPLMSMIVHPYLGAGAAKREMDMPLPEHDMSGTAGRPASNGGSVDPFKDLPLRFTYRTARVLDAIAAEPGINNRQVGDAAGVHDQGQMSKLLRRLQHNGLITNQGEQLARGEPNAWTLTQRGYAIHTTINAHTTT
jgi:AcrR family transcriptional regulator